MSTSTVFGQEYAYFGGMASAGGSSVLPPQAIPKKKKNEKWKKACLDNLEREGLKQYKENIKMVDYYRMISGDKSYMDIDRSDKTILTKFLENHGGDDTNIPSYIKHYDLLYPIVSKIVGDWVMQYDKLRFDTTDAISVNEYIQERTFRLNKYSEAMFKQRLDKMMLQLGIDIKQDFKSEEEFQEYQQQQQQVIEEYFPERINQDMRKNWKTEAAQWAERTWQRDFERFKIHILESLEARDILLVGKSARHYRVAYDYYYPEYWHPIEVFHSKEGSLTRMEDAEFAGRVKWYSITELMNLHGDILSEKERNAIYSSFYGPDYKDLYSDTSRDGYGGATPMGNLFKRVDVPFRGYFDHKLAMEFEEATGIPQSEYHDLRTGEKRPVFTPNLTEPYTVMHHGAMLARALRQDYEIRTDTIQTTEVYWKGSKRIGLLTYRSENGYVTSHEVDEEVLPEVKEKYKLKHLKSVSLSEYEELPDSEKEGTIIWVDTPVVYKGLKIKCAGHGMDDDIYKVEELPFQIKGDKGNIFDVKLPVCGHIGDSYCKLIRPYQIAYNYFMNQIMNYGIKEWSALVMDVGMIPSDYFGEDEGIDSIVKMTNVAKTTGMIPVDASRNSLNQAGGGLQFNPMQYVSVDFTGQIQRNLQLSQQFKMMAMDVLGLNPTAMGSPSQYATVEGVQVGQKAYYAQTHNIEQALMENKRSNVEIHVTVAQYCQKTDRDSSYIYVASNEELEFIHSIKDEHFDLRKIDVRSTYNATKNMQFQQLKQIALQNNTMGADPLTLHDLVTSDDALEYKAAAMRARQYAEQQAEKQREHEMQMQQMIDEKEMRKHADKIEVDKMRVEGQVQSAVVRSMGYGAKAGEDSKDEMDYIKQTGDAYLKRRQQDIEQTNAKARIEADLHKAEKNMSLRMEQLQLDKDKLALEREKLNMRRYESDNDVFTSTINKN